MAQTKIELLEKSLGALKAQLLKILLEIVMLQKEYEGLNTDELQIFHSTDRFVNLNRSIRIPSLTIRRIIVGAIGTYVVGTVLGESTVGVTAALISTVVATGLNVVRPFLAPDTIFEYRSLPFDKVDLISKDGTFKIIEENPKKGILKVSFYGPLWACSDAQLDIYVKRKNIPSNVERMKIIEELIQEKVEKKIEITEQHLKVKAEIARLTTTISPILPSIEQKKNPPSPTFTPTAPQRTHRHVTRFV